MSDETRLLTRACLSLSEVKTALYQAGADNVYTCAEIDDVIEKLDYAYWLAEEAEAVVVAFEPASKHGVEVALNRPNREKIVSLVQYRLQREARQREAATNFDGPGAA